MLAGRSSANPNSTSLQMRGIGANMRVQGVGRVCFTINPSTRTRVPLSSVSLGLISRPSRPTGDLKKSSKKRLETPSGAGGNFCTKDLSVSTGCPAELFLAMDFESLGSLVSTGCRAGLFSTAWLGHRLRKKTSVKNRPLSRLKFDVQVNSNLNYSNKTGG